MSKQHKFVTNAAVSKLEYRDYQGTQSKFERQAKDGLAIAQVRLIDLPWTLHQSSGDIDKKISHMNRSVLGKK